MKVLLVSPPTKFLEKTERHKKLKTFVQTSFYPTGLLYLAAVLEEAGIKVMIKDLIMSQDPEKDLVRIIKKESPDIVGTSCYTDFRASSIKVLRIAKETDSSITTVMGGSHADAMYEQIISNYPVDIIVLGEGEKTFLEVCKQKSINKIKGLAFKKDGKVIKTEPRPLIENLDELPFPARHLIDRSIYKMDFSFNYCNLNKENWLNGKKITELKYDAILTSRGCPNACTFCSVSTFWHRRWRSRSTKNILEELQYLYDKGTRFILFDDDNFTMNPQRVIEISKGIMERGMEIRWNCSARADLVTPLHKEMLIWMKKSGCTNVGCGVESGSPQILKNINKCITVENTIKTYKNIKKAGIDSTLALIVGNVGENDKTVQETIRMLDKTRPGMIGVNILRVLPNTKLYELARTQGFINDSYWLNEEAQAPIYTYENSLEQLLKWKRKIMLHFYKSIFGPRKAIKFAIQNPSLAPSTLTYIFQRMTGRFA